MESITIREWCDLELFMISNDYTGSEIKAEKARYVIINEVKAPVKFVLNGDMANEFNNSYYEDDYYDEQDGMGL